MKIFSEKTDFMKAIIIAIRKWDFIIAIKNRDTLTKMLKTQSMDELAHNQHIKYKHGKSTVR